MPADATALPYADGSFSVVYSNSVIEHLGSWENQQRMASEVRRLWRGYLVQTPNRIFPVEPRYLRPSVHYLPTSARRHVVGRGTVPGRLENPSMADVEERLASVGLLGPREFRALFPDGTFADEHFTGLSQSLPAYCVPACPA